MEEDKTSFSFSEKAFIVVAWIIGVIAGYFMPVSILWKPLIGVAVFATLLAGWVFIENTIQEKKMNRRDIWGCIIFVTIFSASWFGYNQGMTNGHRYSSAMVAFFLLILILIAVERFFEIFFEENDNNDKWLL